MKPNPLDNALGVAEVEALMASSQPRFFAALGELDWYSGTHRQWIDDLNLRAGNRVLEVGCATGALTKYMTDSGYSVTGLDRSSAMIRRANKTYPHLDFQVGDATELPADSNTYDTVIAASVINVVPDAKAVLSEMHRVCAPGGTISVLVPSADFTDDDLDGLVEKTGISGFSRAALSKWHRGPTKKNRSQIDILFRSAGLEPPDTRLYLDGMLVAATAVVRPALHGEVDP